MANLNDRLTQNVAGPYYVDSSCVDCDMCRNTAPSFFNRDDDTGFSFVYRQPVTIEEQAQAEEAKQGCPTESIGSDGQAVTGGVVAPLAPHESGKDSSRSKKLFEAFPQ